MSDPANDYPPAVVGMYALCMLGAETTERFARYLDLKWMADVPPDVMDAMAKAVEALNALGRAMDPHLRDAGLLLPTDPPMGEPPEE